MTKKFLVAGAAAAAFASFGMAGTASAASTDLADFHMTVTDAKVVVQDLLPLGLEIPGSEPALAGAHIDLDGVIDKSGKIKLSKAGFAFPAVGLGDALPIPGLSLDILQLDNAAGVLSSTVTSVPLSLGVSIGAGDTPMCLIKALNFRFTTGNATVGSTTLFGSPWDKTTGAVTLTGTSSIPALSAISSTDCPVVSLLGSAGIAGKQVAIKLSGTTTIGAKYLAPAKATVGSSSLKFSKGKGKGIVSITCAGSSSKARPCEGSVALTVGGITGPSVPVSIKPGKKSSLSIDLTAAQLAAVGKKTLSGSLAAMFERGTATLTKSVKVSNK